MQDRNTLIGTTRTIALLTLCGCGLTGLPAAAAVLNVPDDYRTIQAAIAAARSGDEVLVATGTYRENLQLRSGIDVRGAETARTFLSAADDTLPVVQANGIDDALLANFTFIDSATGVLLTASTNVVVANNVFDSLTTAAVVVGITSVARIGNNVFWSNNAAIDRFTGNAAIVNNLFARNLLTIISSDVVPIDPNFNVAYNCYYLNNDLTGNGAGRGTNFQVGDPLLVATANRDFHLREGSPCIDTGTGTDSIDDTVADIGAYGGEFADATPFWLPEPVATDTSTATPQTFNIRLTWDANEAYLVTNTVNPGSYRVWYQQNQSGPPFAGTDAGNGAAPSPIDVGNVTSYTLADLQPAASTPGAAVLVSATPANRAVKLGWNAVPGATGYRVYYGSAAVTDNVVNVGNVTSYSVAGLVNNTPYQFAVDALTQPVYYLSVTAVDSTPEQNESDFAPTTSLELGSPLAGPLSNTLSATPDETIPFPNLPDDGCFIASAAFNAKWAAEVQVLRTFRNRYLLSNAPGRSFVAWYYRNSPTVARYLNEHAELKPLVRAALWPLILLTAFLLGSTAMTKAIVASLAVVLVLYIRRAMLGPDWRTWRYVGYIRAEHDRLP